MKKSLSEENIRNEPKKKVTAPTLESRKLRESYPYPSFLLEPRNPHGAFQYK